MKPIGIYAALLFSARLASWCRISVVPVNRSSGVSQSWKNTTFMPGRTRAPQAADRAGLRYCSVPVVQLASQSSEKGWNRGVI